LHQKGSEMDSILLEQLRVARKNEADCFEAAYLHAQAAQPDNQEFFNQQWGKALVEVHTLEHQLGL